MDEPDELLCKLVDVLYISKLDELLRKRVDEPDVLYTCKLDELKLVDDELLCMLVDELLCKLVDDGEMMDVGENEDGFSATAL